MFAYKGRSNSNWAFNNIIRFLHYQKERVEKKEITAGTVHNYIKTLKMFCEVTDIVIPWKRITRGLPKGRMFADDRAPTLEEIHKIIEYPDRRMKPIVYTMASSGLRVGAWDHLKWGHVFPIASRDGKLVAAKVNVFGRVWQIRKRIYWNQDYRGKSIAVFKGRTKKVCFKGCRAGYQTNRAEQL
jgi:hypothetical protein